MMGKGSRTSRACQPRGKRRGALGIGTLRRPHLKAVASCEAARCRALRPGGGIGLAGLIKS